MRLRIEEIKYVFIYFGGREVNFLKTGEDPVSSFFSSGNLDRHRRLRHNGRREWPRLDAFENANTVLTMCNDSNSPNQDVRRFYRMQVHRRRFSGLQAEKLDFKLSFQNMNDGIGDALIDHVRVVVKTLENVMHGLSRGVPPHSQCRLVLMSESLDPAVNFPNMPVSEVASGQLFSYITAVLQSHQEMDMNLLVGHLILVRPPGAGGGPAGGGKRLGAINARKHLCLSRWVKSSRNLIAIPVTSDGLCGLRALFCACYLANGGEEEKARHLAKRLTRRVKALATGLRLNTPLVPASLDYAMTQRPHLFEGELNVYGTSIGKKRLFRSGVKSSKKLNLLLHLDHYHVIKDVAKFMGKKFYCYECDSAYDTAGQHVNTCKKAADRCFLCHKPGCPNRSRDRNHSPIVCKVGKKLFSFFVFCFCFF